MNELNDLFRKNKPIDKGLLKSGLQSYSKIGNVQNVEDDKIDKLKDLFSVFRALADENLQKSASEEHENKASLETLSQAIQVFTQAPSLPQQEMMASKGTLKSDLNDSTHLLLNLLKSSTSIEEIIPEVKKLLEENLKSKELVLELLDVLLLIDSELEQRLMLEYLYAAYSIETEQEDSALKEKVLEWQQLLISIAREEMGHLITVQNVRKSLGLNMYFKVNDLSELTNIFPYISKLEPFSKTSLAKYIFAESPKNWINTNDPYAEKVRALIDAEIKSEKSVSNNDISNLASYFAKYGIPISVLFNVILLILEHFTTATDFSVLSVTEQARPEQWNRGYSSDERILMINGKEIKIPASHVLVQTAMTRWECIEAIKLVAEQGEDAPDESIHKDTSTHFNRFLKIFKEWDTLGDGKGFKPSKNMATNPSTSTGDVGSKIETSLIQDSTTLKWARLLNIRYSLLIAFIEHSFNIEANFANQASSLRGLVINGSFGEMYHLKAISAVLSSLPMVEGNTELLAGPPFEMRPILAKRYSKVLQQDADVSKSNFEDLYVKFIQESNAVIKEIPDYENNRFLLNLQNNDRELLDLLLPQS